jgi:hypothetical protein
MSAAVCPACGRPALPTPLEAYTKRVLRLVPPDTHARVRAILDKAQQVAAPEHPPALLLLAFDMLARDLADQGHPVEAA